MRSWASGFISCGRTAQAHPNSKKNRFGWVDTDLDRRDVTDCPLFLQTSCDVGPDIGQANQAVVETSLGGPKPGLGSVPKLAMIVFGSGRSE